MKVRSLTLALLLLGSLAIASLALAQSTHTMGTEPGSKIKAKVETAFQNCPPKGYLPMRVTITNGSGDNGVWTLTMRSQSFAYGFFGNDGTKLLWQKKLPVPAGESRLFELVAPVMNTRRGGGNHQVEINGPSTRGQFWVSGSNSQNKSVFGIASDTLRIEYGGRIQNYFNRTSTNLSSGTVQIGFWSEDWRAYTGIDILWFQQSDWETLPQRFRQAILQAVAMGGDLRILKDKGTADQDSVAALPGKALGRIQHGVGTIRVYPYMDGQVLFEQNNQKNKKDDDPKMSSLGASFWLSPYSRFGDLGSREYKADTAITPLDEYFQPGEVNFPLLIIAMILFALIIGPLNLWLFAKGRKRYRMLFTTPLIAILFSCLIALIILVADGLGGEGRYSRLFVLVNNSRQEVVFESQYALTGLLLNRDFDTREAAWLVPLGSRITGMSSLSLTGDYRISENEYSGNWFGSRRIQGLTLTEVRPSRSGFELRLIDGKPHVVSSFPGLCPELYIVDSFGNEKKNFYRATQVTTGSPSALDEVDYETFLKWQSDQRRKLDSELDKHFQSLNLEPGMVLASVEKYTGDAPETLTSIQWKNYCSLLIANAVNSNILKKGGAE